MFLTDWVGSLLQANKLNNIYHIALDIAMILLVTSGMFLTGGRQSAAGTAAVLVNSVDLPIRKYSKF